MNASRPLVIALLATGGLLPAARAARAQSCDAPTYFNAAIVFLSGTDRETLVADFDRDGKDDVISAGGATDALWLARGTGMGNFGPAESFAAGGLPGQVGWALAVADFDHDGDLDVAMANFGSGSVSIYLWDKGADRFPVPGPPPSIGVGSQPTSIAAGDLNGDSHPDLVVANSASTFLSVLLGNGDGTFVGPTSIALGAALSPVSVALGDLNRDGRLDAAISVNDTAVVPPPQDRVRVVYGNGDGTFGPPFDHALPASVILPRQLMLADFTEDGRLDMAVANNATSNDVSVFLANGTGFDPFIVIGVGGPAVGLEVVDANEDGKVDLVAGWLGGVRLLLGDGAGGFAPSTVIPFGAEWMSTGDFDHDGRPDLFVSGSTTERLLSDFGIPCALASFGPASRSFPSNTASAPSFMVGGDLTNDGALDLVVVNQVTSNVSLLKGDVGPPPSFGGFTAPFDIPTGGTNPRHAAIGFMNGDGFPDLVVTNFTGGSISVLLNDGVGNFNPAPGSPFTGGLATPTAAALGDFNDDTFTDVAVANGMAATVTVFLGSATGSLSTAPGSPFPIGATGAQAIAAGDFNEDGHIDVATANPVSQVYVLLGNGLGGFGPAASFPTGASPAAMVVLDFDRNGHLDLATANQSAGNVTVLFGNGTGSFGAPVTFPTGAGARSLDVGFFNADGNPDLAVANFSGESVSVLLGDGTGGVLSTQTYGATGQPLALVAGDADGDGLPDVAVALSNARNVLVFPNRSLNGLEETPHWSVEDVPTTGDVKPVAVFAADFDRDGKPDVVTLRTSGPPNPTIHFRKGDGMAGFTGPAVVSPANTGAAEPPRHAAVADFDRDGKLDLAIVVGSGTTGRITYRPGVGDGSFASGPPITTPTGRDPRSVAAADFDQDGKLDLAVAAFGDNLLAIHQGFGGGSFNPPGPGLPVVQPRFVAVGDFDGNGDPDLAVTGPSGVDVYRGTPGLGFSFTTSVPTGPEPVSIAVADFNRDGTLDLAVANRLGDTVSIVTGRGDGTFDPKFDKNVRRAPTSVVASDFDGDGALDLAVANSESFNVGILLGDGQPFPGFGPPREWAVAGERPNAGVPLKDLELAVTDLNLDGRADVVASHSDTDSVAILANTNCKKRRLGIFRQPSTVLAPGVCNPPGTPFVDQPVLHVIDDGGNRIECDSTGVVTASLQSLLPATLNGDASVTANTGVVGYGSGPYVPLSVQEPGHRYRLFFDYPGVAVARSRTFSQAPDVLIDPPPNEFCENDAPVYFTTRGLDLYRWRLDFNPPDLSHLPHVKVSTTAGSHVLVVDAQVDMCSANAQKPLNVVGNLASVDVTPAGPFTVCASCTGQQVSETHTGGASITFGTVTHQWGYRSVTLGPITDLPGQTGARYTINGADFPGPGTYLLVVTSFPTCGAPQVSADQTVVVTAAAPGDTVQFFTITSKDGQNLLEWLNPPVSGSVVIHRRVGAPACTFPTDALDITTFLTPKAGSPAMRDFYLDADDGGPPGLTNGTQYCYTLFVDLGAGFSAGRSNKGRPFDTTTGPGRWAFSVGTTALTPPGNGVGVMHLVANDSSLHAVRKGAGGGNWAAMPWTPQMLNGPSFGRPSGVPIPVGTASRVTFLGDQAGLVHAINTESGVPAWTVPPDVGDSVVAGPSAMFRAFGGDYDYILAGSWNASTPNCMNALALADGTPVWSFTGAAFGDIGVISGQAAVDYERNRVYFASRRFGGVPGNKTVWCVDLTTGGACWAKDHGDIDAGVSFVVGGNRLYVGTTDGRVLALNRDTGDPDWTFDTLDGAVRDFIMVDRLTGDIYFSTDTRVWALTSTMSQKWPGGRGLDSPSAPVYAPGTPFVYVGAKNGELYRLNVADGTTAGAIITLGEPNSNIGSPTLDLGGNVLYVGSEAGVFYAVSLP